MQSVTLPRKASEVNVANSAIVLKPRFHALLFVCVFVG